MKDKENKISETFGKLYNYLTEEIYGLDKVKVKIMQAMCSKILNPTETSGKIIALVGPPGVGKTSVALAIAKAMSMPFDHIPLGGITDPSSLAGDPPVFIGSEPGAFTKILIKAKRQDVVILLDEVDKIANTKEGKITNVLIHALDPSQNYHYKDNYAPDVPIDLSKCIFLCTANDIDKVDPILRDRIDIIDLVGYTVSDKANILNKYLIPKFKKELNFGDKEIEIDNKCLEYLISHKTNAQPGMRDAERKLRDMMENLALLKYNPNISFGFFIKGLKFPLKVTEKIIDRLLDNVSINNKK